MIDTTKSFEAPNLSICECFGVSPSSFPESVLPCEVRLTEGKDNGWSELFVRVGILGPPQMEGTTEVTAVMSRAEQL